MALFPTDERRAIASLARVAYCNPFDPSFVEGERAVLSSEYVPHGAIWL